MTHEQIIEVVRAHKEGKEIEYLSHHGNWLPCYERTTFNFADIKFRIKPTPKLRPMRAEEFPPVWWFNQNSESGWHLVNGITSKRSHFNSRSSTYEFASADPRWQWSHTHSPKPEEIKSFFVEATHWMPLPEPPK